MEVAKLYATLGFNIKDDGLNKFQSQVTDVAKKLKEIQKASKSLTTANRENVKASIDLEKVEQQRLKTQQALAKVGTEKVKTAIQESKLTLQNMKNEDYEANRQAKEEQKRLKDRTIAWRSFLGGIVKAGLLVAGTMKAIKDTTIGASFSAIGYSTLGLQTGVSSQTAQLYQAALAPYGVGREQTLSDLSRGQMALADIRLGKGDVSPFQLAGIDISSGRIEDVLTQVQKLYTKGYDKDILANIMGQLGFGAGWQRMLAQGGLANADISNMLNNEQISQLEETNKSMEKLKNAWKNFLDQIGAFFSPMVKNIIDSTTEFLDLLTSGIKTIYEKLFSFGKWLNSIGQEGPSLVDEEGRIDLSDMLDYLDKKEAISKVVNNNITMNNTPVETFKYVAGGNLDGEYNNTYVGLGY